MDGYDKRVEEYENAKHNIQFKLGELNDIAYEVVMIAMEEELSDAEYQVFLREFKVDVEIS